MNRCKRKKLPLMAVTHEEESLMDGARPIELSTGNFHGPYLSTFDRALQFVRAAEGGLNTDPRDAGNRGGNVTFKGITQPTYNSWLRLQGREPQSVRQLTEQDFRQLMFDEFYRPLRADELPEKVSIILFDIAVNSGPRHAVGLLQETLRIPKTRRMDQITLLATQRANEDDLAPKLLSARINDYTRIATIGDNSVFLKGWLNRVEKLKNYLSTP